MLQVVNNQWSNWSGFVTAAFIAELRLPPALLSSAA